MDEAAAGGAVAGHRIVRLIGRGATSSVYQVEATAGAAPLALKLVDLPDDAVDAGDAGATFLRAAATAGSLQHPDIVAVHRWGLLPRRGWLTMDLVPGCDLARYTQPARLLPERLVVRIGMRLARALAHAHARGVVHCDLKPANVRVHWPSRGLRLCDFGLAREVGSEITRSGVLLGSPAYMAPELLAGATPDAGSDVYALGVMLFELLTGRRPHESTSMGALLQAIASVDAPALHRLRPGLPAALNTAVASLLCRDPARRLRSAADAGEALQAVDAAWPTGPAPDAPDGAPDGSPGDALIDAPGDALNNAPDEAARATLRAEPR